MDLVKLFMHWDPGHLKSELVESFGHGPQDYPENVSTRRGVGVGLGLAAAKCRKIPPRPRGRPRAVERRGREPGVG
jgi:hypothetical protein